LALKCVVVWVLIVLIPLSVSTGMADSISLPQSTTELRQYLANRTFLYPSTKPDQLGALYLNKSGEFNHYIPCYFKNGHWSVSNDGELCLNYHQSEKPRCLRLLKEEDEQILITGGFDQPTYRAHLLPGYRLPFG
jgi:hypothetical protein